MDFTMALKLWERISPDNAIVAWDHKETDSGTSYQTLFTNGFKVVGWTKAIAGEGFQWHYPQELMDYVKKHDLTWKNVDDHLIKLRNEEALVKTFINNVNHHQDALEEQQAFDQMSDEDYKLHKKSRNEL